MKSVIKRISLLLLIFLSVNAVAQTPLAEQADSAYTADDFAIAADLYKEVIKTEGSSAALYYNLGNCYYRMGRLGDAIVAYERALRLDPSNTDALKNLEFVNSKIIDRGGDTGTFISNTVDSIATSHHANTWAWIAFSCFALLIGAIALYMFTGNIPLRKLGFFGGLVLLICTVASIVLAIRGKNIALDRSQAIITAPSVILGTSPREPKDRNEEAMLLHEGTKVTIIDSVSSKTDSVTVKWYDVQVDNNHRAWISSRAVEII